MKPARHWWGELAGAAFVEIRFRKGTSADEHHEAAVLSTQLYSEGTKEWRERTPPVGQAGGGPASAWCFIVRALTL